jgi:ribosomal protein S18 acetylase RimI-like enzyme
VLSLIPARTDQHYESLLNLIFNQKSAYLTPYLDLVELTWEQFGCYFRQTGIAYQIYSDQELVGMCWVDEQADRMILLGLVIRPEYQSRGIGSQTLVWLEVNHATTIRSIELLVHRSNPRAKALYERLGYHEVQYSPSNGFFTLRKPFLETVPVK